MLSEKTKETVKSYLAKLGIDLPATKVEPVVTKLEDVALIDGTMLSVDKMEVGAMATFTGADGVAIPAEGEFELAAGGKVICAAGVITEIMPKEADAQPEPAEEEMKAMLSKLSERLDTVEKAYKASLETNKALEAELKENKKGLAAAFGAIEEFDKAAVAISLESQKEVKKDIDLKSLTPFQKFKLAKYGKID